MKNLLHLITLLLLISNANAKDLNNIKPIRVTYLANSGFLVKIGQTKLMFDGSFQNGMDLYQEPDEATVELMKRALPPFNDVSYVFISNYHADHCDPFVLTQFMLHNTEAKLICPQQVINRLMLFTADYQSIKKRVIEATPATNCYDRIVIGGIEVTACNLKDEKRINDHVENIAYLVNVNGVKLFHSGDSSVETLDDLKGINLNECNIDIAFLNVLYGVGKNARQTNKLVNARYTVLMHLEKYITDRTLRTFCEHSKLSAKPYVFNIRNDYHDFYINDFFTPMVDEEVLTLSQP